MKRILYLSFLILLGSVIPTEAQTVVTLPQGGTVTFCETRTQGVYITGDPWIVGPVTICNRSINPGAASPNKHGCMVDPNPPNPTSPSDSFNDTFTQGWDNQMQGGNNYDANLNWCDSYPSASITATKSIVFADSKAAVLVDGSSSFIIDRYNVVTVVTGSPGGNAFRPAFAGGATKTHYQKTSIRYNVLQNFPLVTGQATIASELASNNFRGPFIMMAGGTQGWEHAMAQSFWNTPGNKAYGRVNNNEIQKLLLTLHTTGSDATKEPLVIRAVQAGIDIYGQHESGRYWNAPGGFCIQAGAIGLAAASILNNQAMMDAFSGTLHPFRFCHQSRHKYITQTDVNTPRNMYCGSNGKEITRCEPFTSDMIGRSIHCDGTWTPGYAGSGAQCSSDFYTSYVWLNSAEMGLALVFKWMSLEEECGCDAFIDYMYSTAGPTGTAWPDLRWSQRAITNMEFSSCAAGNYNNSNGAMQYVCGLWTGYRNATPLNGSVSGGTNPNIAPSLSLTSPTSPIVYTTAATQAITLACTDPDGTCGATTFVSDCDATTATGGTAAAPTTTINLLTARSACRVTATAVDNLGLSSSLVQVDILRQDGLTGQFTDNFALTGTAEWPLLDPARWTPMFGTLIWKNNRAESTVAARNFSLLSTTTNADQQNTITLPIAITTGNWAYVGVRGNADGGTYDGMGLTAEVPISRLATFINSQRLEVASWSTPTIPAGTQVTLSVIGQQYCPLHNGIAIGACYTDTNSTFTGGGTWIGLWGAGMALDNPTAVELSPVPTDSTAPSISVATPAGSPIVITSSPYTLFAGTLADNIGGAGAGTCTWLIVQYPTTSGSCTGWANWTIPSIVPGGPGDNTVQITGCDAATTPNCTLTSRILTYQPSLTTTISYVSINGNVPTTDTFTQAGSPILHVNLTSTGCDSARVTGGLGDHIEGGSQILDDTPDAQEYRIRLDRGINIITFECVVTDVVNSERSLIVTFPGLPDR